MSIALLILVLPLSLAAQDATASITGAVVDPTGVYIAHAKVELNSGTQTYQAQTDEVGAYRFSKLPAGEYAITFKMAGFRMFTLQSVRVLDRQERRIPDVPLDVGNCGGQLFRKLILLDSEDSFGRLTGSVTRPAKGVRVTLVCRTFAACRSTQTDSKGRFSFDMLSPGNYGLSFGRDGFYSEIATGYFFQVNAGWESVYSPVLLERCFKGNCDPKLRPARPPAVCE